MLKILYDFRAWQVFYQRGVGRYVGDLFEAAIRQQKGKAWILLYKEMEQPVFPEDICNQVEIVFQEELDTTWDMMRWDVYAGGTCLMMGKEPAELFPLAAVRRCAVRVSVLYDFIPLFFQEYIPDPQSKRNFAIQTAMTGLLDHIFTNSQTTQALGVKYLGRSWDDFTCLYGGANQEKFASKDGEAPYRAEERNHQLVYVSGAFAPQKNNDGFVKAFCEACRQEEIPSDSKLYIICKADDTFKEHIRKLTEENGCQYPQQVEATGFIPDEDMIAIIRKARASIFPSFCEGLGLPILESYLIGTPCWASGISATQEVVMPECTFDPFDQRDIVRAIVEIYEHPELCEKSLIYGRKLVKKMTWEHAAEKMLNKLNEIMKEAKS